jgi:hypothetical protein
MGLILKILIAGLLVDDFIHTVKLRFLKARLDRIEEKLKGR